MKLHLPKASGVSCGQSTVIPKGHLLADVVENVACGDLGIYGLYGAISVGTTSDMLVLPKVSISRVFSTKSARDGRCLLLE